MAPPELPGAAWTCSARCGIAGSAGMPNGVSVTASCSYLYRGHRWTRTISGAVSEGSPGPPGLQPRTGRHGNYGTVSSPLLSDDGMPIEHIARLVGHTSTAVTETVYRQQIRPVIVEGAEVMDRIFGETG